jgi:hypothetical protein
MTVSPALARDHGGWGGHHRRHHDGFDGGDFLLGALVVGGIAVAASAANSSKNVDRPASYPGGPVDEGIPDDAGYDAPPEARDYPPSGPAAGTQSDVAYGDARSALDACSAEASRDDRGVEAVDGVARESDGYRVDGRTRDGQDFTCSVDRDGRIRHFELDAG